MAKKFLDKLAIILLLVGGLNWGLSLFDIDLVAILADMTFAALGTILYAAVGLSAVWAILGWKRLKLLK